MRARASHLEMDPTQKITRRILLAWRCRYRADPPAWPRQSAHTDQEVVQASSGVHLYRPTVWILEDVAAGGERGSCRRAVDCEPQSQDTSLLAGQCRVQLEDRVVPENGRGAFPLDRGHLVT